MPNIGEIKTAKELGYKSKGVKYIWLGCPNCSKERWIQYVKRDIKKLCFQCANRSRRQVGNTFINSKGYRVILLAEDDFFFSMANDRRWILEHRLIMAKHLGRCLHSWEIVHHKNHIRQDNRIENLQLQSDIGHKQLTIMEQRIDKLEVLVKKQSQQIKLLQWQLKEQTRGSDIRR